MNQINANIDCIISNLYTKNRKIFWEMSGLTQAPSVESSYILIPGTKKVITNFLLFFHNKILISPMDKLQPAYNTSTSNEGLQLVFVKDHIHKQRDWKKNIITFHKNCLKGHQSQTYFYWGCTKSIQSMKIKYCNYCQVICHPFLEVHSIWRQEGFQKNDADPTRATIAIEMSLSRVLLATTFLRDRFQSILSVYWPPRKAEKTDNFL